MSKLKQKHLEMFDPKTIKELAVYHVPNTRSSITVLVAAWWPLPQKQVVSYQA